MADSQAGRVRNYVQGLGRNDRYIVMLYYADGLTPIEISRVLDLPSNDVQARLEELRTHLAGLTTPKTRTTPSQTPRGRTNISAYA